ncbi:DNA-binding response regulator, NarL/FixJ family, contains REC and HTH domains [Tenacibaculum sp. MAR_2009_124]|uniref:response regulator transcription factor n=1 Tax=Tenacibaculum sp. MAR_2009_124 TaxID=1250059 RepID=UPI000895FFFA|nr:response regulator transcription factor [Tenacibaculum sp. MAR_2009_124]SEC23333.1 DNA-binding response regulator, NarL/FixJ family, contains REC and HTH domains [Tenacibaculum sp. MAR_2009_124]
MDIVLVDDHLLVRDGIKSILKEEEGLNVINEASNGIEALDILKHSIPDILIVDIKMPKMNGIEVVREIKKAAINVKTMMLSMHDSEEYVLDAIEAGADGYLLKGSSKAELVKALHTIASGGKYFTGDISSIIINNLGKERNTKKIIKDKDDNIYHLTKREKQILKLILSGKSNKEIAAELEVSKRTTEVHRFNLMKKLKVKNLTELSNKATELNL